MLKPYHDQIEDLVFIYAHVGKKSDNGNRIYSVASEIIKIDYGPSRFSSHIFYKEFTVRERYRSNLSLEKLNEAPPPEVVQKDIQTFLKGQKFAFSLNKDKDVNDIKEFCGVDRIIDLNFASEFFLQYLEFHSIKSLWEYLRNKKRSQLSFSATEIVELSIDVVKRICSIDLNDRTVSSAQAVRYYLNKSDTLFGKSFHHINRNYKKYFGGLFDPFSSDDSGNWKRFLEKAEINASDEKGKKSFRPIPLDHIKTLFSNMAKEGNGYSYRTFQVKYACEVTGALNTNAILCIEAGTGTGKTQGYLIPAMEFLRCNPEARVVVSTYTKSLQNQIFQREIGFTQALFSLYKDIPVALLKGKSSYICAEKLDYLYDDQLSGSQLLTWLYLLINIYHYRQTDADNVGVNIRYYLERESYLSNALRSVSAKDGCSSRHVHCPAQVLIAEARNARLVVTNHHKLVLLDQEPALSGLFKYYIIDEANHFENAVRNALRTEANSRDVSHAVDYIEKMLRKVLPRAAGELEAAINKILNRMPLLQDTLNHLRNVFSSLNVGSRRSEEKILPAGHKNFHNGNIENHFIAIREAIQDIEKNIKIILNETSRNLLKITTRTAGKLQSEINMVREFMESISVIGKSLTNRNSVVSYVVFRKSFSIFANDVEVKEKIRKYIYSEKNSVIYTSATMCPNNGFEYFKETVGLTGPFAADNKNMQSKKCRMQTIPSPFHKDAMKIVVHPEAVSGRFANKRNWLESVVTIIPKLVISNKGRTLVLFSSYDDLKQVTERIVDEITDASCPVIVQAPGLPTFGLCDAFREIKESVLFGVDTFWYGVDFKGDTLTQVIITRLPYPSTRDPLMMARRNLLPGSKYWERYNYEKEIKLQQGIGRLIRSETDKGRVVVLDSRYNKKTIIKQSVIGIDNKR